MNDISRTPNTDQVLKALHWVAVKAQGRNMPLVAGAGSPEGQNSTPSPQEGPGWGLWAALVTAQPIGQVLTKLHVLPLCQALGGVGDREA